MLIPVVAAKGSDSVTDVQKPSDAAAGEECQVFTCVYLGSCEVTKPSGMDLLNEAVEQLLLNTAHWVSIQLEVTDNSVKVMEQKVMHLDVMGCKWCDGV